MNKYKISDIQNSIDRYKIFILPSSSDKLSDGITYIQSNSLKPLNIGNELATFIDGLEDLGYLNIDVCDYLKRLLDNHKSKINDSGNDVVALYNIGILMEPALELNAVQLLKEFSKSTALIIIWENEFEIPDRLYWPSQRSNVFLDFSEIQIKKLQYAI